MNIAIIGAGFGMRFAVLGQLGERFTCAEIVGINMAEGRNGMREGQGFYDCMGVDIDAYKAQRMRELFHLLDASGLFARFDQALFQPPREA